MWTVEGMRLVRAVNAGSLRPLPLQRTYDVVSLNRERFDLVIDVAEARSIVEEESELLERIEAARDDRSTLVDILDERYEDPDDTAALDAGMAGAVSALTARGAVTITSCNGGVLGDPHSCEAPTVLFACHPALLHDIDDAAVEADCGLIDNGGFVELFADDLRKMNRFARVLLDMDVDVPG